MEPGYSKSISYSIRPVLFTSNETGKNYTKEVRVTGNFPDLSHNFSIQVRQANIQDGGNNTVLGVPIGQFLDSIIEACIISPDHERCKREKERVYIYSNDSEREFNQTWTLSRVNEMEDHVLDSIFLQGEQYKDIRAILDELNKTSSQALTTSTNTDSKVEDIEREFEERNNASGYFTTIVLGFATMVLGGWFILFQLKQNKTRGATR